LWTLIHNPFILVSSTKEFLDVWYDHYNKLASDTTGTSFSVEYWNNITPNEFLLDYRDNKWDINQNISTDEIQTTISSTPNFKASGSDDIPIEFFKS